MFKFLKTTAVVVGLSCAGAVLACSVDGKGGFLPDNDLYIPVGLKGVLTGITEAQFNSAIDKVETLYAPIVASLGGKLEIERKWSDGTVNAYAQQSGKTWKVAMFGGLARHKTITEDGMALVVCHELGHHIGGAPKKVGGIFGGGANTWASNEGQADYFATLKCLRKSFLNDDNIAIVAGMTIPKTLSDACKKSTKNDKEDSALCIRTSMAGKSVANLFSELSKLPDTKFETPDAKVVSKTDDAHPKAQCRLDTYFQGSLCDISMNEDVSQKEEVKGTCHPTLGHKTGTRPLCWFKPKMR
ncbi:MAG: M48 family metalloprotease [Bdellovibrionales bacterium]|nr:M48 family metalloprotease [Bdellovibrionales bacterium]